jgi:hypothetical protein
LKRVPAFIRLACLAVIGCSPYQSSWPKIDSRVVAGSDGWREVGKGIPRYAPGMPTDWSDLISLLERSDAIGAAALRDWACFCQCNPKGASAAIEASGDYNSQRIARGILTSALQHSLRIAIEHDERCDPPRTMFRITVSSQCTQAVKFVMPGPRSLLEEEFPRVTLQVLLEDGTSFCAIPNWRTQSPNQLTQKDVLQLSEGEIGTLVEVVSNSIEDDWLQSRREACFVRVVYDSTAEDISAYELRRGLVSDLPRVAWRGFFHGYLVTPWVDVRR